MSIQSTVNQGISLVSLLVAQTPIAKQKETEDAAKRQQQISEASEKGRQAGLQQARDARAAQDLEETRRLFGEHSALIKPIGNKAEKLETIEGHIGARRAAVESGRKLQELEPTEERLAQLSEWETEIGKLEEKKKGIYEAGRAARKNAIAEGQENRAAKRKKKREEAEASAAEAQAEEQRRQAITREITRPFDPAVDKFRW